MVNVVLELGTVTVAPTGNVSLQVLAFRLAEVAGLPARSSLISYVVSGSSWTRLPLYWPFGLTRLSNQSG